MATIYTKNFEINNIEAVLFDKDGTFIDSNAYWGKLGELRVKRLIDYYKLDKNLYNTLCTTIGYNPNTQKLIDNGPLAVMSRDAVIEVMTNKIREHTNIANMVDISKLFYDVHSNFLRDIDKYTQLIDGSLECFKRLKNKNLKLAVVTADSYEHTCSTLKLLNIDNYFDTVVGCDSCREDKSTGIPGLYALGELNILPQNAIVIGDTPMDAKLAINSQCKASILVTTGQVPKNELKEYSDYVISNLDEVMVKDD